MILLNEDGKLASSIYTSKLPLSLCDPVMNNDGMLVWYVTNDKSPLFIKINPYQLSKVSSATKSLTIFSNSKFSLIGRTVTISGRKYKIISTNKVTF